MTNPHHILVIDDEFDILDSIRFLLEDAGYAVTTARTPEPLRALTTTTTNRPDLILLDMLIAGSDGRDLMRGLRADAATRDIPVIMFSAYPNAEAATLEAGATAFLAKPFEIKDLLSLIQAHLPPDA